MDAWVDALHVDARVVARTVAIAIAPYHSATIQSISVITLTATTVGFMVVRVAFGVHAAIIRH